MSFVPSWPLNKFFWSLFQPIPWGCQSRGWQLGLRTEEKKAKKTTKQFNQRPAWNKGPQYGLGIPRYLPRSCLIVGPRYNKPYSHGLDPDRSLMSPTQIFQYIHMHPSHELSTWVTAICMCNRSHAHQPLANTLIPSHSSPESRTMYMGHELCTWVRAICIYDRSRSRAPHKYPNIHTLTRVSGFFPITQIALCLIYRSPLIIM